MKSLPKGENIKLFSTDWSTFMYDMDQFKRGLQKPGLFRSRYLIEVRRPTLSQLAC